MLQKKLIQIKELPNAKVIENLLGEVITNGMVKILIHNKNIPIDNKEKNTVLFFCTDNAVLNLQ